MLVFGDDAIRPYAYTYRDYVTKAFNADVPYDRFITDQLAADQTAGKDESWRLAAMGFLTLGRLFDYNLNDEYDDRIDTVSRGLLGLTVACARCHDHKYDAISQADYYGLYGVFASSEEPAELPLMGQTAATPAVAEFREKFAAKEREFQEHVDTQFHEQTEEARRQVGDYLLAVATTRPDPNEDAVFFMSLSPHQLRPQIVGRWRRYVARRSSAGDPVFGAWGDFMRPADADFESSAPAIAKHWLGLSRGTAPGQLNPLIADELARTELHSKADVARIYSDAFRKAYAEAKQEAKEPPAAKIGSQVASDNPARQQLLDILAGSEGPAWFPRSNAYLYMSRVERDRYHRLQLELDRVAVKSRATPPRAMVVNDAASLCNPRIFVRGNAAQPGEHVPRQFLRVLAGDRQRPFAHGSGRLDLARAIASRENPLTARVFVNRVWMNHFGDPLVQSPSDFGVRATPPTQSRAARSPGLRRSWPTTGRSRACTGGSCYRPPISSRVPTVPIAGGSIRKIGCVALQSTAARHGSHARFDAGGLRPARPHALRPRDRHRRRSAAAGRRTIYGLVDRQHLPGFHRAFDFANPDQSAERRPQTTVPQQALFAMNSPFMLEQARSLANRPAGRGPAVAD